jgi:DnaD/phage-associated family protein
MAWIESHQELERHPKTTKASMDLKMDRYKFIGHIHALWWWALDYADSDGNLPNSITIETLTTSSGLPKSMSKKWSEALLRAGGEGSPGFLEHPGDHFVLHDWHDYAGKLLTQREANKEKQRRYRNRHVTVIQPLRNQSTVPNRTVPNRTVPTTTAVDGEIFRYFEENFGQLLTPIMADQIKDAVGQYSVDWVKDAISESIKAGVRKWNYVSSILERWKTEGKGNGRKSTGINQGRGEPIPGQRPSGAFDDVG